MILFKFRRKLKRGVSSAYYRLFHNRPRAFPIRYNELTGPYELWLRLADGPGMPKRLRRSIELVQRTAFLRLLKPGWVCCDVGAHVGDYTVEMGLLVGDSGRVVAYEPVRHYHELLQRTIKLNGLAHVEARLAVVGASAGEASVPTEMLTGTLQNPGRFGRRMGLGAPMATEIVVPVVSLDDELEHLDAAKIDCEGYEFEVLSGMERLIRSNRSMVILLEVHPRQLGESGRSVSELGEMLLTRYRLRLQKIGKNHCLCGADLLELPETESLTTLAEFEKAYPL